MDLASYEQKPEWNLFLFSQYLGLKSKQYFLLLQLPLGNAESGCEVWKSNFYFLLFLLP